QVLVAAGDVRAAAVALEVRGVHGGHLLGVARPGGGVEGVDLRLDGGGLLRRIDGRRGLLACGQAAGERGGCDQAEASGCDHGVSPWLAAAVAGPAAAVAAVARSLTVLCETA